MGTGYYRKKDEARQKKIGEIRRQDLETFGRPQNQTKQEEWKARKRQREAAKIPRVRQETMVDQPSEARAERKALREIGR